MSNVFKKVSGEQMYIFACPGCGYCHFVRYGGEGPKWSVTGADTDKPTVSPSILSHGKFRCHSFVKNGEIQFLSDCDHHLTGKTVPLPNFDLFFSDGFSGVEQI